MTNDLSKKTLSNLEIKNIKGENRCKNMIMKGLSFFCLVHFTIELLK